MTRKTLFLSRPLLLCARTVAPHLLRLTARGEPGKKIGRLRQRFEFRCDERDFAVELLSRRANFWAFRTSQVAFCGDFVLVDMSSPAPKARPVFVLDLKLAGSLRVGSGGVQLRNAAAAVDEIATRKQIIPRAAPYEQLIGSRESLLAYFGVTAS